MRKSSMVTFKIINQLTLKQEQMIKQNKLQDLTRMHFFQKLMLTCSLNVMNISKKTKLKKFKSTSLDLRLST
jgi:hypothetical protein